MSCNITVSVSDDFAKEAKRLAKKYPSFKQDYKDFLDSHTVFFFTFYFDLYMDSKRICKRNRLRLLIKWKMKDIIKKSFFFFFALTPSHMWLKRPVYRCFSGEGKCEGKLSALTPPSHPHGWILLHFVTKFTLILPVNKLKKRYQKSIAPWYQQYSIGIPTV